MLWRVDNVSQSLTLAIGGLTLAVIAFGRVPGARLSRAAVAFVGATALLAVQAVDLEAAVRLVNGEVLLLLFSLMVVNASLASAGAFRLLATLMTRGTLGPKRLLALLVLSAGVLSALFLNDTVVLMLTPLVVRAARRLGLPPLPYLLGLALAANAGSVATVTGNPQNVLVAVGAGIGYGEFAARIGPVALLALAVTLGVLLVVFRRELRGGRLVVAGAATAGAVAGAAGSEGHVAEGHAKDGIEGVPVGATAGPAPLPRVQRGRLLVSGAAALLMLAGFVAGVPVALAAAIAAALLLASHGRGASLILKRVDYELLVLFAGLFVVVGAIAATGLPEQWLLGLLGAGGGALSGQVGGALGSALGGAAAGQVATGPAGLGILTAVTAALSTLVSNVPAVLVLLPALALPTLAPPAGTTLGLTVAMASTLAGNLTLMASVANLIVAESARRLGEEVGFWAYLRVGVPVTLLSLLLGWLYLAFVA
jgi:Na+/H+ antiporter NhaD/arsenite permease-like protein